MHQVRNAVLSDMPRLGHIMAVSFRSAFRDFVPKEVLAACAVEENCAGLLEGLFREGKLRLLMGNGQGFLAWQEEGEWAEIAAIHSLPESWGTGLGAALLDGALAQIRSAGKNGVFLWAFRDNLRARRFYEKQGFRRDGGERTNEFGAVEVRYILESL